MPQHKMKQKRKFAGHIGVNFCFIVIIIKLARAEESVETEREEDELPALMEILGDRAPLVANTRTAISGALAYGILGRHSANEATLVDSVLESTIPC